MILCENCLETVDAEGWKHRFPIGREFGSQRDPERHELILCLPCQEALTSHDLATFNERYSNERKIAR